MDIVFLANLSIKTGQTLILRIFRMKIILIRVSNPKEAKKFKSFVFLLLFLKKAKIPHLRQNVPWTQ